MTELSCDPSVFSGKNVNFSIRQKAAKNRLFIITYILNVWCPAVMREHHYNSSLSIPLKREWVSSEKHDCYLYDRKVDSIEQCTDRVSQSPGKLFSGTLHVRLRRYLSFVWKNLYAEKTWDVGIDQRLVDTRKAELFFVVFQHFFSLETIIEFYQQSICNLEMLERA